MNPRFVRLLAWLMAAFAIALLAAAAVLVVVNRDAAINTYFGSPPVEFALVVLTAAIPALGAAIATRRPENSVGWIFLVGGLGFAFGQFSNEYAIYAYFTAPGALPGRELMVFNSLLFVQVCGALLLMFLFLLFPTGRPPSSRWRPIVWTALVSAPIFAIGYALRPGPFTSPWNFIDNPFGLTGEIGVVMSAFESIGRTIGVGVSFLGAAGLLMRLRAATGIERQQLKLFVFASVLLALYVPAYFLWVSIPQLGESPANIPFATLGVVLFVSVPIAAGIAVLRYRLYDIDLLIHRTLVYGSTSTAMAATFFLGIVGLQGLLRPLTAGSELAVAASTLMSFALFQPIRRRVQGAVDRRFDRSRYDAARTLDLFADRLRDEVDLDALRGDLLAAVRTTMAPAHASLWLRDR